jgi:hypothetical protein
MKLRSLPLGALRWAAILQALLVLPSMLAGSICLRGGEAATLELGTCECVYATAPEGAPALSELAFPDCGPCQDLTLTALAGSRVITPVVHLAGDIGFARDYSEIGQPSPSSIVSRHPGDPPGRHPAVLRC